MAAPLSVCTKEEQCSVIRILWSEGVSETAIYKRFSTLYGNTVLPQRSDYEWIEKSKHGRTNTTHAKGVERPYTASTEDNIERAPDMVLLDDRLLMKWQMFRKLAMANDESQNNSLRCINKRAWTSAKTFGSLW